MLRLGLELPLDKNNALLSTAGPRLQRWHVPRECGWQVPIRVHMYEVQIKLKADSPQSRLVKESTSPILIPGIPRNEALTLNAFRPAGQSCLRYTHAEFFIGVTV